MGDVLEVSGLYKHFLDRQEGNAPPPAQDPGGLDIRGVCDLFSCDTGIWLFTGLHFEVDKTFCCGRAEQTANNMCTNGFCWGCCQTT